MASRIFGLCRKTRPTNRGLRQCLYIEVRIAGLSEDSPHKSGIKTTVAEAEERHAASEDSPHKSGIKTCG